VGSLLTFDIPQTALVATLDTYDVKRVIMIRDYMRRRRLIFNILTLF
jgi:hypothetical protein